VKILNQQKNRGGGVNSSQGRSIAAEGRVIGAKGLLSYPITKSLDGNRAPIQENIREVVRLKHVEEREEDDEDHIDQVRPTWSKGQISRRFKSEKWRTLQTRVVEIKFKRKRDQSLA